MKPVPTLGMDVNPSIDEELLVHEWRAERLRRLGIPTGTARRPVCSCSVVPESPRSSAASSPTSSEPAWSSGQGDAMAASRNGHPRWRSYPEAVALRCLIVDDNPGFLHAARALLEQEGIRVVGVASTGADALRRAAELHPDVTLLDIDLGAESGFDVARQLVDGAGNDPGHLIFVSAYPEDEFLDLIETSPAIGFLRKPSLSATAIVRLLREAGEAHDGCGETPVP